MTVTSMKFLALVCLVFSLLHSAAAGAFSRRNPTALKKAKPFHLAVLPSVPAFVDEGKVEVVQQVSRQVTKTKHVVACRLPVCEASLFAPSGPENGPSTAKPRKRLP